MSQNLIHTAAAPNSLLSTNITLKNLFTIQPNLKKNYVATQYASKNKDLIRILRELINDDFLEKDETLYSLIRQNRWKELDIYIQTHPGKQNFWLILQQLFYFRYFVPESEKITDKQFEISMGIQQVRWMTDDENCKSMKLYQVKGANFKYWEDIPGEQEIIVNQVFDRIKQKMFSGKTKDHIRNLFSGTVWYDVNLQNNHGRTNAGSWKGFGSKNYIYPIPETINLTTIACVYRPILLFGALSDGSLLKYIILHGQRPYIAHLPDSTSNLCEVHGATHCICAGWYHDFFHSTSGDCKNGISFLNSKCGTNLTLETLPSEIRNETSKVNKCIDDSNKRMMKCDEEMPEIEKSLNKLKNVKNETAEQQKKKLQARLQECWSDTWIRGANDSGMVWHINFPVFRGGKRKTKKQKRKARKNKTRK